MDGMILPRTQLEQGVTEPPFHPNCRCTTVPYDEDWDYKGQRIAKDKDGKYYYVPETMSYEEWKREFVVGDVAKTESFNTKDDPLLEVFGSAEESYPEAVKSIMERFSELGVDVDRSEHEKLAYEPATMPGKPGKVTISKGCSIGAWKHELKHAEDDYNDGWLGFRVFLDPQKCKQREIDAYQIEIDLAKSVNREDMVERLVKLRDEELKRYD